MVQAIMQMAEERLVQLNARRRRVRPASDLVVGLQCGGSDAFSGVTANPAVGYAADLLVRAGATVMFSEVTEVRDGIDQLTARAATPEVAAAMVREMAWYDAYLAKGGADRSANTTPGNKKGGLANIVWGEPRATLDIDVTVWVEEPHVAAFIRSVAGRFTLLVEDPIAFIGDTRVLPAESAAVNFASRRRREHESIVSATFEVSASQIKVDVSCITAVLQLSGAVTEG